MIRVKHPSFIGLTGHRYKPLDAIYDREISLEEALPRLFRECQPLAELAVKGLIGGVFERNGELYPLNVECYGHSVIVEVDKP